MYIQSFIKNIGLLNAVRLTPLTSPEKTSRRQNQPSSSSRDTRDAQQPGGRDPPAALAYLPARRRRSAVDRRLWRPSRRSARPLPRRSGETRKLLGHSARLAATRRPFAAAEPLNTNRRHFRSATPRHRRFLRRLRPGIAAPGPRRRRHLLGPGAASGPPGTAPAPPHGLRVSGTAVVRNVRRGCGTVLENLTNKSIQKVFHKQSALPLEECQLLQRRAFY